MTVSSSAISLETLQGNNSTSSDSVRKERVLYAEDDPVQSALILPLLESEGFEVDGVRDGEEALAALRANYYDIVLTDHLMPKMSGVQLLEAITAEKLAVPVVIMTATNDLSVAFAALKSGAIDFISKDGDGNYVDFIAVVLQRAVKKHLLQQKSQRLEAELEREREISRLTLDSMSQGVITLDKNKNIQYCNAWFKQFFGDSNLIKSIGYSLYELASILSVHGTVNGVKSSKNIESDLADLLAGKTALLEYQAKDKYFEIKVTRINNAGFIISLIDVTHTKHAFQTLKDVIDKAPVAIVAINPYGDIVLHNQRSAELLEMQQLASEGKNIQDFFTHGSLPKFSQWLQQEQENQGHSSKPSTVDTNLTTLEGSVVAVELAINQVAMNGEQILLLSMVDIEQRKQSERALRRAAELQNNIIENSPFNIVSTDGEGTITAVSPALERMLGYSKADLIGQTNIVQFHECEELANRLLPDVNKGEQCETTLFHALVNKAKNGMVESADWTYVKRNGEPIPVNLTTTAMHASGGGSAGFLFVSYDITEQRKASEYIRYLAHHDPLTGLPNRALMQDRLNQSILLAKRHSVKTGILMIDLDHFKRINDTLGHLAGDALLKEVASRLTKCVRASDTVCRIGGDEFIIIVDDVKESQDVENVAKKIINALDTSIDIGPNHVNVTPSIGISIAPDDGHTLEELLRHADIAMYRTKQSGRNSYACFSSDLLEDKADHVALEQDLHEAFEKHQLTLHYQPQIDLYTGTVVGFEALLRWVHPVKGTVAPDVFIPIAEQTGLIVPLGEWVMAKACQDIQALRQLHQADYSIAVNVSPRQFEDSNFIRATDVAMRRCGLPPNRLELEITEGLLVKESEHVSDKLMVLKRMGVALSIDDFGTGYSCLSYVAQYPISCIKIDRAFMDINSKENAAIVGAIVAIAQGLGMDVIAEGIETTEQESFISHKGCHLAQGYFYAKPVPYSSLSAVIDKINSRRLNTAS